jgi:hypothetical protein
MNLFDDSDSDRGRGDAADELMQHLRRVAALVQVRAAQGTALTPSECSVVEDLIVALQPLIHGRDGLPGDRRADS